MVTQEELVKFSALHSRVIGYINEQYRELEPPHQVNCLLALYANLVAAMASVYAFDSKVSLDKALEAILESVRSLASKCMPEMYDKLQKEPNACDTNATSSNP